MIRQNIIEQPERLLSKVQVAMRLSISTKTLNRHLTALKLRGLQQIGLGTRNIRFRAKSLDRLIKSAAEREEKLFD
jgi:predicted DNA-binding transcriptional regulator AlpA